MLPETVLTAEETMNVGGRADERAEPAASGWQLQQRIVSGWEEATKMKRMLSSRDVIGKEVIPNPKVLKPRVPAVWVTTFDWSATATLKDGTTIPPDGFAYAGAGLRRYFLVGALGDPPFPVQYSRQRHPSCWHALQMDSMPMVLPVNC